MVVKQQEQQMTYTLMTRTGRIMQFFLLSAAQEFQAAFGGVVISQHVLTQVDTKII